jgi:hypothetical protein
LEDDGSTVDVFGIIALVIHSIGIISGPGLLRRFIFSEAHMSSSIEMDVIRF